MIEFMSTPQPKDEFKFVDRLDTVTDKISALEYLQLPKINQLHYQQLAYFMNKYEVLSTICLKSNGTVSLQYNVQITNKLTNLVLHDKLEPYTKG